MTTVNYLRMTKAVERAEKELGGPLREALRTKLNEPGVTMSSIAKDIDVQKATLNYWMAKLGINYGRVAHFFDEEVRVVTQEEGRVLDAILEMGLSADDLDEFDPEGERVMRRLEELGVPVKELSELSASQVVALRRLARLGLNDDQIDLIDTGMLDSLSKLLREGVSSDDVANLSRKDVDFINNIRSEGVDVDELSGIGDDWLVLIREAKLDPRSIASIDADMIGVMGRVRERGIELDEIDALTSDELALIKQLRVKRSENPERVEHLIGMVNLL